MADPFAIAARVQHRAAGSVAAIFTPADGDPTGIRVIRSQESKEVPHGDSGVVMDTDIVSILLEDVADPTGGTLAIGDETFEIQGAPLLDVEGVSWTCPLQSI